MTRDAILAGLRAKVADGRGVIGAGAGTGLSAKCAEAGGVDRSPVRGARNARLTC